MMGWAEIDKVQDQAAWQQLTADLGDKSLPELLAALPPQELMKRFRLMGMYPAATQELVLSDILRCAAGSDFARANSFAGINSVEAYQKQFPLTDYENYRAEVEKMAEGAENVLFNGPTPRFIATSGTTGIAKLLPESKNGELAKAAVARLRLLYLLTLAPEVMAPGRKVLSITNPAEYAQTKAGIPVGSASGQAVKDVPPEIWEKLLLPPELLAATDLENDVLDYLILRYALGEEKLVGVVCSNVAHFQLLLQKIPQYRDDLLQDLANGSIAAGLNLPASLRQTLAGQLTPMPQRAAQLRQLWEAGALMDLKKMWPEFSVISCWMAASSARIVADFRRQLPPEIKFLEWGYGASEGKFNIPTQADLATGELALFGYFFEFIPLDSQEPLLLQQLTPGKFYELVVTSYSGLYRYKMKDIVFVEASEGPSPRIVFVAKASDRLQLGELKLYIHVLEQAIDQAAAVAGDFVRFFQVFADEEKQRLVFFIEPGDESFPGEGFARELEAKLIQAQSVVSGAKAGSSVNPPQVVLLRPGYRDALFRRSIMPGKSVNQTKLKAVVQAYPEAEWIIRIIGE